MLTELRPKKELLNSEFSGYKLSLDPIPVYRQKINEGVDHSSQSEDQYSFTHTKVFSLHNHLHADLWHDNTVFFVDKAWRIRKAVVNSQTSRVEALDTVWTVPQLTQRVPGHYNISLMFPSPQTAVLADGCGNLHILNRNEDAQWQVEWSRELEDCGGGSLLMAARLNTDSSLHCVLMSLHTVATEVQPARSDKPKPPAVNTTMHWITLKADTAGSWSVACTRRLEGAGSVDYVAFEDSCSALYIGSNTTFKFTEDSANPLPPFEEEMNSEALKPLYTWEQTPDDLKVTVEVGPELVRDDVEVMVTETELMIKCQQQTIVYGRLGRVVDTDLTTWTLQPCKLEVTLSKRDVGLMWTELVSGDTRGQQVVDPAVVEKVHSRLGHLCSDTEVQEAGEGFVPTFNLDQLEECDSALEDNTTLARLDAVTHSISHQIALTGHQWLASLSQSPDSVPTLIVRHDVDGCVWRLDCPSVTSQDWPHEHISTFCALGYVAASKQQKKFIKAAPDLSYAVICEALSHVFVYRKASVVDGELRNRKTSTSFATVAKQQLINLESQSPILGAYATNSHLFVLTLDTLYTFHIQ